METIKGAAKEMWTKTGHDQGDEEGTRKLSYCMAKKYIERETMNQHVQ